MYFIIMVINKLQTNNWKTYSNVLTITVNGKGIRVRVIYLLHKVICKWQC